MTRSISSRFLSLVAIVATASTLGGCGMQPMLAERTPAETPQKFVLKISGSGYGTYRLRRELEKSLVTIPKMTESPYVISVAYQEASTSMGYGRDATVVRSQTTATGTFQVMLQGKVIGYGAAEGISSYSLNYFEEYSTLSAQKAASERAVLILVEELTKEILMAIKAPNRLIP